MSFFDIFASPRWSPLRIRTKVVSFFLFFQELSNKKKIKALRPKMTKIASRGGSCLNRLASWSRTMSDRVARESENSYKDQVDTPSKNFNTAANTRKCIFLFSADAIKTEWQPWRQRASKSKVSFLVYIHAIIFKVCLNFYATHGMSRHTTNIPGQVPKFPLLWPQQEKLENCWKVLSASIFPTCPCAA